MNIKNRSRVQVHITLPRFLSRRFAAAEAALVKETLNQFDHVQYELLYQWKIDVKHHRSNNGVSDCDKPSLIEIWVRASQ